MEMSQMDFRKKPEEEVNQWAMETNEKALKSISKIGKDDTARNIRRPLAGDPEMLHQEMAVVASSIYLKIAWRKNLFSSKKTKPSEPFFVKLRGEGPHEVCKKNQKIFIL